MLTANPAVYQRYPAATFAWMTVQNITAPSDRMTLDQLKQDEIEHLRRKHAGYERASFINTEPVRHYVSYYKSFGKTYPVLLQLESILLKNKGIPAVGTPVETMFLAEVQNTLLTAGHDSDRIQGNLRLRLADGTERCCGISGKEQQLTAGDLYLSDDQGILSSILCGPDQRTKITDVTKNVLYFVYGVEGISTAQLRSHLENIAYYLAAVVPGVSISPVEVLD